VIGFWARQGSNPNTSTVLVDIEGAPNNKDAGVDTAIVVYLFETLPRWDASVLFTNDTDFVPAVHSLRRQGKRVFCASHTDDKVTPLVQACQHFYAWDTEFLDRDWTLWDFLQAGGDFDQFLEQPAVHRHDPAILVDRRQITIRSRISAFEGGERNALNEKLKNRGYYATQEGPHLGIKVAEWSGAPPAIVKEHGDVFGAMKRRPATLQQAKWSKRLVL
jgi:hypothetical protein